ncbi:MAG: rhodanese-like domain-containing protein [Ignavibacteriaceae bacterium]|nr:rhodanese-like domain-containing protein [Ignavibacteriaceae bacterium]
MIINYFNPEGIPLIREKIDLKWAPDSLFLELDKSNPEFINDSSSLNTSGTDQQKKVEDKQPEMVIREDTKPLNEEPKKIKEEIKEAIVFTEPKAITLEQAYTLFKKGITFVDSRDETDYILGHISNSMNIPFDDFDNHKQKLEQLSREKPMVIYCAGTDCDLSHLLANLLFEQGYKQVYVFFGGWNEWLNANYPIQKSAEQE